MGFEVHCSVAGDRFDIAVPNDCSVGDVLRKASEQSGVQGVSLWCCNIRLNLDHMFADYVEQEAIYHVRVGWNYPEGNMLSPCEGKLNAIGVAPEAPQLLMAMEDFEWSMDEFLEKAGGFAPTLVLFKMKNGTKCGGVAGVPWPEIYEVVADPASDSFLFSLGATPARFDLVKPWQALYSGSGGFRFGGFSSDLHVWGDGRGCGSRGQGAYAGPREPGELIGGTAEDYEQPYERWELWRL
jgi:hypothetical protein